MDMYQKRKLRKEQKEQKERENKNGTYVPISCPILPNVKSALNPYK